MKSKKSLPETESGVAAVKKPLYKKGWFWTVTIVAAVVVALVLASTLSYAIPALGIRIACKPRNVATPDGYEEILNGTKTLATDLSYESADENGYMDIYAPKNVVGNQPLVVYVHGGYYIGGDKEAAEPYCRMLAEQGFVVANINYALAPEAKYPTQLRQLNEAIVFLRKNAELYHIDKNQIFIAGDSAGGHLAAQAGTFYTNKTLAQKINITPALDADSLKGVILLCGFYNTDTVRETRFPFVNTALWAFTDVRKYENYSRIDELNVVANVTKDYPDTFITCGGADPFYSQAEEMVAVLEANGVDYVKYLPTGDKKLDHEFQRDFDTAQSYTAMDMTITFMLERSDFDETVPDTEKNVIATFALSTGDAFEVRLFPEYAPETVANFIEYAENGFYNGTVFHRVLKGTVLQGGGYTLSESNDYIQKTPIFEPIKGEFSANGYKDNVLSHVAGVISMARASDFNSATSQFFFCATDVEAYDGQYAAFGMITSAEGIEAVQRLTQTACDENDRPLEPVTLISVTIRYTDK